MADPTADITPENDILAEALTNLDSPASNGSAAASPITARSRPLEAGGGGEAPEPDEAGGFGAFLRGAADAVSFGFGDEIGGFIDTLGVPDMAGTQYDTIWNSNKSFAASLTGNIAKERANLKGDTEDHYKSQLGGQVFGSLLVPFGSGAKGALGVAKVGALQGALYGVGSGEGTGDRVVKGAEGAAIGGVLGAAIGKVTEVAGNAINKLRGKVPEGTPPVPEETIADFQPTAAGPDGTVVATKLEDGSTLAGWKEDGSPFYKKSDELLVDVEGAKPPMAEPVPLTTAVPDEANPGAFHEQPVGSIAADQLDNLKADIAKFRDNPDLTSAEPQGQWRIGNLGDNADTQGLLSALSRQLPASGRKTDQELATASLQVAGAIGDDPEAILAWAKNAAGTLGDVDNTMMTLRAVWSQAGKQVSEHIGIDWTNADDTLVASAGQAIRNLSELSQQVQLAKVGLGRGLRVNSLPDAETYLKQLLAKGVDGEEAVAGKEATTAVPPREAPPLPRNRKELKDWFDLWNMHKDNPKGQADFLQGLLTVPPAGKYLRTSFANFFTASILSAPRTIAMNIVGPAFISVVRNAERFGGASATALNPFATAADRAAARAVAKQTPIAYFRTLGDIGEAFRYGLQAAERNNSVIGGGGTIKDGIMSYGPLTEGLLGATGTDPNMMYTLGNLINVFPKAFARVNNGLDETAKRLAYMGEVRVRAQVQASTEGLAGDAFREFVRNALKNSVDEVGAAADADMLRAAERSTFTSRVGEEGTWVRRWGDGMQALRKDIPELRYIVPVFNVPANALGETLRRLPISRMPGFNKMFQETAADLAGENGVVSQAEAHGRTMLGASFLMAGVMLNRMGTLTGAGPQEPTDRKVWLQTHQPYSIRLGDEWVRYDKFDILGGLLSIPATISDASTYRAADQSIGDMMASGAGALSQWMKDRAALRTATALLNAGSDPTNDMGNVLAQLAGNVSSGFVPAALRTLTVDTTDPYVRMRRSWEDYMKATIPGLSNTLEPTRNVLGEPINRSADTFGEALFPVTMQPAVTYKDDPVMDELARVYEVTGYGAGADPKSLGYGFFNPKDVKLEDGRSIYDRAMQLRQTIEVGGKTLRQSLKEVITSAEYQSGVDADSTQKETSLGDVSRGYLIKQVFDSYNKAAKAQLANESPLADAYLTAAAAKQRDDAYLRDFSVDELVKTPRLYSDRGIDASAYSDKIKGDAGGDPLTAALGL